MRGPKGRRVSQAQIPGQTLGEGTLGMGPPVAATASSLGLGPVRGTTGLCPRFLLFPSWPLQPCPVPATTGGPVTPLTTGGHGPVPL